MGDLTRDPIMDKTMTCISDSVDAERWGYNDPGSVSIRLLSDPIVENWFDPLRMSGNLIE